MAAVWVAGEALRPRIHAIATQIRPQFPPPDTAAMGRIGPDQPEQAP